MRKRTGSSMMDSKNVFLEMLFINLTGKFETYSK
jgi:hypothetical protein